MQTIILATDFSATAENATRYATELAKYFYAKLILLNACVVPEGDYEGISELELKGIVEKRTLDRLKGLRKKILSESDHELAIGTFSAEGSPHEVIKEAVKQFQADLVVMGVSEDTGFINEFVLQSTSIRTAKQINTYTLLVPKEAKYKKIHKLALACDFDHTENTTVPYVAKYFTTVFDSELEIVNVNPKGLSLPEEKENTLHFIDDTLRNVKHKLTVIKGLSAKQNLRDYFEDSGADIVMVMPGKHNFLYYLFDRSVTNNLAGKIKAPVLIIH